MTAWRDLVSRIMVTLVVVVVLATAIPDLGQPTLDIHEEFVKAFAFALLMSAIILRSPFGGFTSNTAAQRIIEWVALASIWAFTYTYMHELLIEKPDLFPDTLGADVDPMSRMLEGVPVWVGGVAGFTTLVLIFMNWQVWGGGIAAVAVACLAYVIIAALGTAFGWFEGNKFLAYGHAVSDPMGELHKWLIVGDDHSLLGRFPGIFLSIVVPFVVLGSLFSATGGGRSLIKLAFKLSRNLRGGPGHAAIMSSSIFGTMSGGPVVNVLATGVLTIPMMLKRNFSRVFAGGVESAASSGGQVVPPVMGVAAFFLADFTGVPYGTVIIAALLPAAFYYLTLFTSVTVEARKLQLEPIGENLPEEYRMNRQDYLNLIIVVLPILVICTVLSSGYFSVTAAGMFAVASLLLVAFIDPNVREKPLLLLHSLSNAGLQASHIMLLFMAVAVVASSLSATGFTNSFGTLIAQLVESSLGFSVLGYSVVLPKTLSLMVVLTVTMLLALVLGMGMPTLPAYVNVTIVMSAVLGNIGLSLFAANMFVFYFAVASAITPPVAVASFAAASITKANPLHTSFMSLRLGMSMFLVPFVFAFYPELLLIDAAFVLDSNSGAMIESRPNGFEWEQFVSIVPRLCLAIFIAVSAFSAYDFRPISRAEARLRFMLLVPMLVSSAWIWAPACLVAAALLARSYQRHNDSSAQLNRRQDENLY